MSTPGKKYNVSDGEMVITLEIAQEGGFVVSSPMEPELNTQAETIDEAFAMARDAMQLIHACRQDQATQIGEAS
ncbi:MAG: type II toxin-antitoxin system HicB family antitoxin [Planctomycetota bacterium]